MELRSLQKSLSRAIQGKKNQQGWVHNPSDLENMESSSSSYWLFLGLLTSILVLGILTTLLLERLEVVLQPRESLLMLPLLAFAALLDDGLHSDFVALPLNGGLKLGNATQLLRL